MTIGIYKIENLINHKLYIGQSHHIEKRWQEHCRLSAKSLIGKAIQKYGKNNFSFQILEECKESDLNEREAFYIHQYDSLIPNGYNIEDNSNGKKQYFLKYDKSTFLQIVKDIKNLKISFKEIAAKYSLDLSMIYYINRGDYHFLEEESYPLREVKDFSKKEHRCIDCGIEISKGATRCSSCAHKLQYRCNHPNREELKRMIREDSFTNIGKNYGVSDNTVKKWCIKYSLPYKKSEIKRLTEEEWNKI